jgi:hypothetical protein
MLHLTVDVKKLLKLFVCLSYFNVATHNLYGGDKENSDKSQSIESRSRPRLKPGASRIQFISLNV